MASYNDLDTSKIALVGFVGAFVTFLVIIGLQVLYLSASNELTEERVIQASTTDSDSVINEQKAKLTRYRWIDAQNDQAVIPIERAMELVVEELSAPQTEEPNDEA
jgi:hypothetical protein